MIREVTVYRVECDEDGCDASPQDGGEFHAWADAGTPIDEAQNADWIVRDGLQLCPEHGSRKVCMGNDQECPRRDVTEAEDGWMYCPDHVDEGTFAKCKWCGVVATHTPCCSAHEHDHCCRCYRRTHFVEIRPCCTWDRRAMDREGA